jgi:hypothetical protein
MSRTTPAARAKNKSWRLENGSRSIVVDDDNQGETRLGRNCAECVPARAVAHYRWRPGRLHGIIDT